MCCSLVSLIAFAMLAFLLFPMTVTAGHFPISTNILLDGYDPRGLTPLPTPAPRFAHIARQESDAYTTGSNCTTTTAATCGYIDGNYTMSIACEIPLYCVFSEVSFTQSTSKLFGCGEEDGFGLYTACRNYTTSCDSSNCNTDNYMRVCAESQYPFCIKYVYEPQGYVNYQCEQYAYNEQVTISRTWTGASFEPTKDTVCFVDDTYSGNATGGLSTSTEEVTLTTTATQTSTLSIFSRSSVSPSLDNSLASTVTLSEMSSPTSTTSDARNMLVSGIMLKMALLAIVYWRC